MKKITLSLLLLAQSIAVSHADDGLSYTYFEGSIVSVDYDDLKGKGLSMAGSRALNNYFSVIGGYSFVRSDDEFTVGGETDNIEVKTATFGFSLNAPAPVTEGSDFVFSAQYIDTQTGVGGDSAGVDGESYSLQLRTPIAKRFEVFGGVLHMRGAGNGETGYTGGLLAGVSSSVKIGLNYSTIDDVDTAGLFVRVGP